MQVESPTDIICAYANQVVFLERKLERFKKQNMSETDPAYVRVLGELTGCRNALDRMKGVLAAPKGQWVLVLRSKVAGLAGKVGFVTYVNEKHNFASVIFDGDPKPRNLGMGKLEVISLPPPTMKIPAVGMIVYFENNPTEYVSIKWEPTKVFVEPRSVTNKDVADWDRYSKRVWKDRFDIVGINGVSVI